jgi:hypothetical protein
MCIYVIYHRKTGDVVHVHIEPDEVATSREGLLAKVDATHGRDTLDVALVSPEQLAMGIPAKVDPATGQLEEGDGPMFGARIHRAGHVELPATVSRIYRQARGANQHEAQ